MFDEGEPYRNMKKNINDRMELDRLINGPLRYSPSKHCDKCGKSTYSLKELEKGGKTSYLCSECYESESKSGDCFITTACVKAMKLPDNCPELNTLRVFREKYVKNMPNGENFIAEYYRIAPKIVKLIDNTPNSQEIYAGLYKHLVKKSITLIEEKENEKAFQNIYKIVGQLKNKYL